jgi:type II secretory pathway pseudopilin PulG
VPTVPGDSRPHEAGFSLVEVIVATSLLATVLVTLAQLFALAIRGNLDSRATTYATVLAQAKLEELRARALEPSPGAEPTVDLPGFVDYVDRAGRVLAGGPGPPANAAYTRRWVIRPLGGDPSVLAIHVRVTRNFGPGRVAETMTRVAGAAELVTMKRQES